MGDPLLFQKEILIMAIFVKDCAICGCKISEDTPYIATSGVAFAPPHPLYKFCDTGLHQKCLLNWPHRRAFSSGYVLGAGHLLRIEKEWTLICGPLMYGPYGKPGWPYYAEIRFYDWPIRLYTRFEEWEDYMNQRLWRADYIHEINASIQTLENEFPRKNDELRRSLFKLIVRSMLEASEHRSRYISAVSLELYPDKNLCSIIPELELALNDEHGSVRNAAHNILKRLTEAKGSGLNI